LRRKCEAGEREQRARQIYNVRYCFHVFYYFIIPLCESQSEVSEKSLVVRTSPRSRFPVREEGQVEHWEWPNELSANTTVPVADRQCQYYFQGAENTHTVLIPCDYFTRSTELVNRSFEFHERG
jgi:hypothetical protein